MNRTSITHCDAHDRLLVEALKHHLAGLFHHKSTLNFQKKISDIRKLQNTCKLWLTAIKQKVRNTYQ